MHKNSRLFYAFFRMSRVESYSKLLWLIQKISSRSFWQCLFMTRLMLNKRNRSLANHGRKMHKNSRSFLIIFEFLSFALMSEHDSDDGPAHGTNDNIQRCLSKFPFRAVSSMIGDFAGSGSDESLRQEAYFDGLLTEDKDERRLSLTVITCLSVTRWVTHQ